MQMQRNLPTLLLKAWQTIKKRYKPDWSKLGTYIQILMTLLIFIGLLITGQTYQKVEEVRRDYVVAHREMITVRDSIRWHDLYREAQLDTINKKLKQMQEITFAKDRELEKLMSDLAALKVGKKNDLQRIGKFSNEELMNYFKNKRITP